MDETRPKPDHPEAEIDSLRDRADEVDPSMSASAATDEGLVATLNEMMLGTLNRLDLDELLRNMLRRVRQMLETEHAFVALVDEDTQRIGMRVATGVFEEYVGTSMAKGEGGVGRVWETGQPLVVDDYQQWDGRSDNFEVLTYRAVAEVPLEARGRVVGVIGIASIDPRRTFGERETTVMSRLAEAVALAIDNAQLYSQERSARVEAETLLASAEAITGSLDLTQVLDAVLTELRKVVPYDSASVQELRGDALEIVAAFGLLDVEKLIGVRFELDDSEIPNGSVVRSRTPLVLNDTTRIGESCSRGPTRGG